MKNYESKDHINVGTGKDITIEDLAKMIASIIEFKGEIVWDDSKPDGTFRKLLDISKLKKLGWNPRININEGLKKTIDWYKEKNYH